MNGPKAAPRAVFFEEAHARAVVVRLRGDGYTAAIGRDRLAGEDDDDDHPWMVTSDAPEWVLDLLVDEHDGWLDVPETDHRAPSLPRPMNLPTAPRRLGHEG